MEQNVKEEKMTTNIKGLTLILSCGCNLSCEYCLLAKSVNKNSKNVQENTKIALENGNFLQNCVKVLEKLNTSPEEIEYIDFWGQEPTLTLDLYTKNIQQWCDTFSNANSYMFATNAKAYPEKIVDFLIQLDKYVHHKTDIAIQFSYDGEYFNEGNRKINSSTITNNIIYIIKELNNITFNNLFINFNFNGVITRELLYNLNTVEKIDKFIEERINWINNFCQINRNQRITIQTDIPLSPEVPYNCSVEDGIQLVSFFALLKKIKIKNILNNFNNMPLRSFKINLSLLEQNDFIKTSLLDDLKILSDIDIKDLSQLKLYNILKNNGYCASNYSMIRVMYDGTLLECHNSIFDTNLNFITADTKEEFSIKQNLINKKRIMNPLIENDKEQLKKLIYYSKEKQEDSFLQTLNQTINLLYIMSQMGQVEKDYQYNYEKLLLHAYILTTIDACPFNRQKITGSPFFIYTGLIKFYCNGFLSEAIDDNGFIKEF